MKTSVNNRNFKLSGSKIHLCMLGGEKRLCRTKLEIFRVLVVLAVAVNVLATKTLESKWNQDRFTAEGFHCVILHIFLHSMPCISFEVYTTLSSSPKVYKQTKKGHLPRTPKGNVSKTSPFNLG